MTNTWKSADLYVLMLTLLCLFYMNIVYSRLFFNLRWSLQIILWHGFRRNLRKGKDRNILRNTPVTTASIIHERKIHMCILICNTGNILKHWCFWKALFCGISIQYMNCMKSQRPNKVQLESSHSSFDFLLHNLLNFATSSDYMASNKLTFCTHKWRDGTEITIQTCKQKNVDMNHDTPTP